MWRPTGIRRQRTKSLRKLDEKLVATGLASGSARGPAGLILGSSRDSLAGDEDSALSRSAQHWISRLPLEMVMSDKKLGKERHFAEKCRDRLYEMNKDVDAKALERH